ncbi:MAG: hypothetical protein IH944_12235 [Armatimonadetes bacterium]|nr:hypothetical protein [Armatimonadota bacterium]
MTNRRKVWWIVGSFVLLVVASGAFGWLTGATPDKLHREALAIAREYGFVEVQRPVPMTGWELGIPEYKFYDANGLDESEIKKIVERLDSACRGGTRSEITKGGTGTMWHPAESESLAISVSFYTSSNGDGVSLDIILYDKIP